MENNHHISQEQFERIEKYLSGDLPRSEADALEKEKAHNPEFKAQVEEIKLILSGVEEFEMKGLLEEAHGEMVSAKEDFKQTPTITIWKTIAWAASLALLMFVSITLWDKLFTEESDLFAQYYEADPGLVTAMSSETNYEFDRGMVDYKSGKYEEAIVRWEKLIRDRPENDTLQYFLGSAHLALKKTETAIFHLNEVLKNEDSAFAEEALWYLGLAYLKSGEEEEAIKIFRRSQHARASEIVNELLEK